MADAKSDYAERLTLDWLLVAAANPTRPVGRFVALLTQAPSDTATPGEVTGGSYARKAVTFGAATTAGNGVTSASNTAAVEWTNMPTTTVSHVAIYDAVTGGNLLYSGALQANKALTSGDNFTINVGNLTVTEN